MVVGTRGLIPVLVTALSLAIAACGFQPMYGARDASPSVAAELGSVDIERINVVSEQPAGPEAEWRSRLGQQLENDLASRFYRGGVQAVRYRLDMDLTKTREGFGFRPDEAVTRVGLRLEARYRLVDVGADKVIFQDRVQAYNSFEVVQSDFATLSAERDRTACKGSGAANYKSSWTIFRIARIHRSPTARRPNAGVRRKHA